MDDYRANLYRSVTEEAAKRLGAVPADIPGLWFAPGYPELTTGQLVSIAFPGYTVSYDDPPRTGSSVGG
jgi:hypothetical protein